MKLSLTPRILVTALALTAGLHASAADKAPTRKILVDFKSETVERVGADARPIHRYEFAWSAWEKKIVFLDGRGILVPALPGDGVLGADRRLNFGPSTHVEIDAILGNRNEADAFTFSLVDADGTQASWFIPIKDQPRGVPLTFRLPLDAPSTFEKPGKKAGLDKAKLKKWELKGNWQPPKLEILFVHIAAGLPETAAAGSIAGDAQ